MLSRLAIILGLALAAAASQPASAFVANAAASGWTCTVNRSSTPIVAGLAWEALVCAGAPYKGLPVGPLTFNILSVDLASPAVSVVPVEAVGGLQALPDMATQDARLLAGINGGYFWRLDDATFFDNVCIGKFRKEAEKPPSQAGAWLGGRSVHAHG